jgi:hypothetical protein
MYNLFHHMHSLRPLIIKKYITCWKHKILHHFYIYCSTCIHLFTYVEMHVCVRNSLITLCLSLQPFVFSLQILCIVYCSVSWINMSVTRNYILITCNILLPTSWMSVNCHWPNAFVYFVFTTIILQEESDVTSIAQLLGGKFYFFGHLSFAHQPGWAGRG